jgi:hypothetical protein
MKLSLTIASFAILLHSAVVQPKKETPSLRRGLKGGNKNGNESRAGSGMARRLLDKDLDLNTGDFEWDIQSEDGFPSITLGDTSEDSEVVFKYIFTGTLTDSKFLDVKLYKNDCVTAADASLAFTNTTSGNELDVELFIIQETISNSVHYQDINNGTAAIILFCLRVDYYYVDGDGVTESINFKETNVTITADLTPNFTLTEISAEEIIITIQGETGA